MNHETDMLPPPPDEDLTGLSDRELLERMTRQVGALAAEVKTIKRRLRDGDTQFRHVDENIGILINSLQALCQARGLAEETDRLGAALERWGARRSSNGADARDVPTNPGNEKPEPPPDTDG